jgi:hypothetical protein
MSETPIAVFVDCSTQEVTQRSLTAEEIAQREADAAAAAAAEAEREASEAAAQAARESAKTSALAKLAALGLTEEEAASIIK